MRQDNIIYVAIHKTKQTTMSGAKGQYAFGDIKSLKGSIGQSYRYEAERTRGGVSPKDLYDIYKVNLDKMTKELVK